MTILDKYIGKIVLGVCLVVLLTITGLDWVFALIAELADVTDRYTFWDAVSTTLLTLPRRFVEHLPMSTMVGCLVALGLLANHSELTVMRAAGVSSWRLLRSTIQPVLVLIFVISLVGEFIAPKTEQAADAIRAELHYGSRSIGNGRGVWHREGNWMLHINAIEPSGNLVGVTLYAFSPDRQLKTAGFARRVEYQQDTWFLKDLRLSRFEADRVVTQKLKQKEWKASLDPELLSVLLVEPSQMSMQGLYSYSAYISDQQIDATPYQLAFWQKLLNPLGIIALVVVAMSSVFGPLRSVTMGQRIMIGFAVGIVLKIVQDLLGPASTLYGFSPFLAAVFPIAVCFLAGGWLLRRAG